MAQFFSIHPTHPQQRLISRAAQFLRDGGVIAYPTDSCYALGCHLGDKAAVDRLRRIREIDDRHPLSIVCANVSQASRFAQIDDAQYRLLKRLAPGAYTFILPATRSMPKRALDTRRKTIGIRIPANPVALALVEANGEPIVSATALFPDEVTPVEASSIRARWEHDLDLVLDAGTCGLNPTTLLDLTAGRVLVLRRGAGSLDASWDLAP